MQIKITIEALNPVIITKRELIIQTIAKMEAVAFVNLDSSDQYKFIFSLGVNEDKLQDTLREVKLLLHSYNSAILARREEPY